VVQINERKEVRKEKKRILFVFKQNDICHKFSVVMSSERICAQSLKAQQQSQSEQSQSEQSQSEQSQSEQAQTCNAQSCKAPTGQKQGCRTFTISLIQHFLARTAFSSKISNPI
jgi:ribosomal protein L18